MAKHETADRTVHYDGPAGGWGSLKGITKIFGSEWATSAAIETLARQNKPHGFMCVSCSWTKPADTHPFEFCEKRRQGDPVGTHDPPLRAGVLRRAHGNGAPGLEGLRFRAAGPPDPPPCATIAPRIATSPAPGRKPLRRSAGSSGHRPCSGRFLVRPLSLKRDGSEVCRRPVLPGCCAPFSVSRQAQRRRAPASPMCRVRARS